MSNIIHRHALMNANLSGKVENDIWCEVRHHMYGVILFDRVRIQIWRNIYREMRDL